MTRAVCLGLLLLGLLAVAGAYGAAFLPGGPPGWAPWSLLVGSVVSLLAMAGLGAVRRGRGPGRLGAVLLFMALLLVAGLGLALLLPDPAPGDRLVLGLPVGAAVLVYGVGLLPLLVVPLAYAWTFPELGFRPGELEAVRRRARDIRRP